MLPPVDLDAERLAAFEDNLGDWIDLRSFQVVAAQWTLVTPIAGLEHLERAK